MKITVLGKSPAWQDAGGACSGYLVQGGGQTVLLDCGPGVFSKLRHHVDYAAVDTVVISHLHADHVLDLVPFASGLRYGPRSARPRLFAPPGALDTFAGMSKATFMTAEHIELAFEVTIYDPADVLSIGELTVRFQPVPHYIPCNAVEFTEPDGARFTFSADCGPNQALCDFAADTDLLLIEATLPVSDNGGHLTPREAGEHGARAGAKRVVLTHFSDELDVEWALAEGAAGFGAPVDAAREGATYELGR
ncbi:MBL fold metallo-hydrolase [Solirubrobacter soli]|uniref:MBL fold metallo-hydrolase n=1 Tax=Solirubrobacter soli TaxID=363832 RepID=UPI000424E71E|nr:MBL fold metallo-hydrolase [Solirubrobacter soli]